MLDFDFGSLPPPMRYAAMVGAAIAGVVFVIRGMKTSTNPTPDALRTAELAAQLADSRLRDSLIEVVRIAREAMEQRIDTVAQSAKLQFASLEMEAKSDRGEIHRRIDDVIQDLHKVELSVARIEGRGDGSRPTTRRT